MPTYEYLCEACGYHFEQFHSITAPARRKCPRCRALALRRLIGAGAGVIFKGSGFYETDYRSESYRKAVEKETSAGKDKTSEKSDQKKPEGEAERAKKKDSD
jgi:putative FmdB family regulatory protein